MVQITSSIPKAVFEEFKVICNKQSESCSKVIRRLIIDYLVKIREEKKNEQS